MQNIHKIGLTELANFSQTYKLEIKGPTAIFKKRSFNDCKIKIEYE
jgi:hypothetical protein